MFFTKTVMNKTDYYAVFDLKCSSPTIEGGSWSISSEGVDNIPEEAQKTIAGRCISLFLQNYKLGDLTTCLDYIKHIKLFAKVGEKQYCVNEWDNDDFRK